MAVFRTYFFLRGPLNLVYVIFFYRREIVRKGKGISHGLKPFTQPRQNLKNGEKLFSFLIQLNSFGLRFRSHFIPRLKNIAKISTGVGWLPEPYLCASYQAGLQCVSSTAIWYPSSLNIYSEVAQG